MNKDTHYICSTLSQIAQIYNGLNDLKELSKDVEDRIADLRRRMDIPAGTLKTIQNELVTISSEIGVVAESTTIEII